MLPLLSLSLNFLVDVVDATLQFLVSLLRRKVAAVCWTGSLQQFSHAYHRQTPEPTTEHPVLVFEMPECYSDILTSFSDSCPTKNESIDKEKHLIYIYLGETLVQRDFQQKNIFQASTQTG